MFNNPVPEVIRDRLKIQKTMCVLIIGNLTIETKQQFHDAEAMLKSKGHSVINPAKEFSFIPDSDYQVRRFLEALVRCYHVHFLPNWFDMPSATLIQNIVHTLKLKHITCI